MDFLSLFLLIALHVLLLLLYNNIVCILFVYERGVVCMCCIILLYDFSLGNSEQLSIYPREQC